MLNHGLPNQRVCFRKRSWGFSVHGFDFLYHFGRHMFTVRLVEGAAPPLFYVCITSEGLDPSPLVVGAFDYEYFSSEIGATQSDDA